MPIFKKGDGLLCENYRVIALLKTYYEILAQCLREILNEYAENVIGEYQACFRYNLSVICEIFTLKEIQITSYEYKNTLFVIFADFKRCNRSRTNVQ